MAKLSSVVKYRKSQKLVEQYKGKRAELKKVIHDLNATPEAKLEAQWKLGRIPKRGLAVRLRLRCELTGRTRGNYRKFKLCRHKFRELAHQGLLPGVAKASW